MKPSGITRLLSKLIPRMRPVLITGQPGVGKTAVVRQVVEQILGWQLVISHPVVADPTDYRGLAWMADGIARFFPVGEIAELVKATAPTVWFIDDVGQAPTSIQAALMQWIHTGSRTLNGITLPECVTIVAATNRREDRAGVGGFLEPFKSRFVTIVNLDVDNAEWTDWAIGAGIDHMILGFMGYRPKLLCDFRPSAGLEQSPSPRTWENADEIVKALVDDDDLLHETLVGTVGQGAADEFIGFKRVYSDLPNIKLVAKDPEGVAVPKDAVTMYAVAGALAAQAHPTTFNNVLRYIARLPQEFQVLFVKIAEAKNKDVTQTTGYVQWKVDNQGAY